MNFLLVGGTQERRKLWRELFELAFPTTRIHESNNIKTGKLSYSDMVICIQPEVNLPLMEFLNECRLDTKPVFCIIDAIDQYQSLALIYQGVRGIVGSDASLDTLRNGIRIVKEGGLFIDPVISRTLKNNLFSYPKDAITRPKLSNTQWKVFLLYAKGVSIPETALQLNLTSQEIQKTHQIIIKRTSTDTIPEAISLGLLQGWFT